MQALPKDVFEDEKDVAPLSTTNAGTNSLGIHFSDDDETAGADVSVGDALPTVGDAIRTAVAEQRKRPSAKKQADASFLPEKLLRQTAVPLEIRAAKPKTLSALLLQQQRQQPQTQAAKDYSKMEALRKRLTPEQFAALKSAPRMTADTQADSANTLLVLDDSSSKIGRSVTPFAKPKARPVGLDALNRQLDVKIAAAGLAHKERLRKSVLAARRNKKHPARRPAGVAVKKNVAPFGFDRAAAVRAQTVAKRVAASSLLYPDQDDPVEDAVDCSPQGPTPEDALDLEAEAETESDETESAITDDDRRGQHSLFFESEAETGSSVSDMDDEAAARKKKVKAGRTDDEDVYDREQYKEDLRGFITKSKPAANVAQLARIHRALSMEDDARAIDAVIKKFNIPTGANAEWMARMHQDYHSQPAADRGGADSSAGYEPSRAEREKLLYLAKLGFTRVRSVAPADEQFLFPEEHAAKSHNASDSEGGEHEDELVEADATIPCLPSEHADIDGGNDPCGAVRDLLAPTRSIRDVMSALQQPGAAARSRVPKHMMVARPQ